MTADSERMNDLLRKRAVALQEGIYRAFGDRAPMPERVRGVLQADLGLEGMLSSSAMPSNLSPKEIADYFSETVDAAVEQAAERYEAPGKKPKPLYIPGTAGVQGDELARRASTRSDLMKLQMDSAMDSSSFKAPGLPTPGSDGSNPPNPDPQAVQPLSGGNPGAARWGL